MKELLEAIDNIPLGGEWWTQSARDTYISAGEEMLAAGMSVERVLEILESLYSATAGEFGG